jgi:hypothetical protein
MSANYQPTRLHLFALATLGAVLLIASSLVNAIADPGPALRVVLALLPVVPLGALAWAIHQAIRQLDELQRRIHLDAMTGAFVGTAFVALVVGQLQHANLGIPELNWAFLWPVQVVLWAAAYFMAARRYQ